MSNGKELSSIDFESMIGGPLRAVIKSQVQAAQTSVDFIKSVGFNPSDATEDPNMPTMVTFTYNKIVEETDDAGKITKKTVPYELSVPLLTMLPIPVLLVEELTIDFNARINSVIESTTTESSDLKTSLDTKGGWGPVSAKLKCSYSNKKSSSSTGKTERTYSMAIHVRAVLDDIPTGMERILDILESNITDVPKE